MICPEGNIVDLFLSTNFHMEERQGSYDAVRFDSTGGSMQAKPTHIFVTVEVVNALFTSISPFFEMCPYKKHCEKTGFVGYFHGVPVWTDAFLPKEKRIIGDSNWVARTLH